MEKFIFSWRQSHIAYYKSFGPALYAYTMLKLSNIYLLIEVVKKFYPWKSVSPDEFLHL